MTRHVHFSAFLPAVVLSVGNILAASGCADDAPKATGKGEAEDMTIVVEADKSRILEQEKSLNQKQESIREERQRLQRERQKIARRLSNLSKRDAQQREKLKAQQEKLEREETALRQRIDSVEQKRKKLAQEKNQLLKRISELTKAKRDGLTLAQREQLVAKRERALAKRERQLAKREAKVTRKQNEAAEVLERATALLEKLSNAPARPAAPSADAAPQRERVTRSMVMRKKRKLSAQMKSRGILREDLGDRGRELFRAAAKATRAKDYASAQELYEKLHGLTQQVRIDRDFVKGKLDRVSRENPSLGKNERMQSLLSEASMFYTDGRWARANRKINQIIAILQKQ